MTCVTHTLPHPLLWSLCRNLFYLSKDSIVSTVPSPVSLSCVLLCLWEVDRNLISLQSYQKGPLLCELGP